MSDLKNKVYCKVMLACFATSFAMNVRGNVPEVLQQTQKLAGNGAAQKNNGGTIQVASVNGSPYEYFMGDHRQEQVFKATLTEVTAYTEFPDEASQQKAIEQETKRSPFTLTQVLEEPLFNEIATLPGIVDNEANQKAMTDVRTYLRNYGHVNADQFFACDLLPCLKDDLIIKQYFDKAKKPNNLPVMDSHVPLEEGVGALQLKRNLLNRLFVPDILVLKVRTEQEVHKAIDKLARVQSEADIKKGLDALAHNVDKQEDYKDEVAQLKAKQEALKRMLPDLKSTDELKVWSSRFAQLMYFYAYNATILQTAEFHDVIRVANEWKIAHKQMFPDDQQAAEQTSNYVSKYGMRVIGTQETSSRVYDILTKEKKFKASTACSQDAVVFIDPSVYELSDKKIVFEDYKNSLEDKKKEERLSALLATHKESKELCLIASSHGYAKDAADGRKHIELVAREAKKLEQELGKKVTVLFFADGNSKKPRDVAAYIKCLEDNGLEAGETEETSLKRRGLTVQFEKLRKLVQVREDFAAVTKGGTFNIVKVKVGFADDADLQDNDGNLHPLPNAHNPSDHLSVIIYLALRVAPESIPTA